MTVKVDGAELTLRDVVLVARPDAGGRYEEAVLDPGARAHRGDARLYRPHLDARRCAAHVRLQHRRRAVQGPARPDRRDGGLPGQDRLRPCHRASASRSPEDVTRAMMLLRANAFASNYSGPQVELVERLLAFLNAGLHPVIPQKGSVGASGDLAPLAHMAGAVCGFHEAEIVYQGRRMPAREAIAAAGFDPNSNSARRMPPPSSTARRRPSPSARSRPGRAPAPEAGRHRACASRSRPCAASSPPSIRASTRRARIPARRRSPATSCASSTARSAARRAPATSSSPDEPRQPGEPPRRGCRTSTAPLRPAGPWARRRGDRVRRAHPRNEINSATDNPLIFDDGRGGYVSISGGHFHGQYMAQAMDLLAIAMADLGAISERRLARLIDPAMSYGLPRNLLAGKRGLNTGYATVQCSMSALVMENRGLATPGSVDSIPGKSNAEDHVSNSTWCGRKARIIVENAEQIVAGELLMAAQALTPRRADREGSSARPGLPGGARGDPRRHPAGPRRRPLVRDRDARRARARALRRRRRRRRGSGRRVGVGVKAGASG